MSQFDFSAVKWNAQGLVPAIAQDACTGEVLMLAWMNEESLRRTLDTRKVTYFSRSRKELWEKGETSGNRQHLVSIYIDCDRDCLLMKINQTGPACHTGNRSCFYSEISLEGGQDDA